MRAGSRSVIPIWMADDVVTDVAEEMPDDAPELVSELDMSELIELDASELDSAELDDGALDRLDDATELLDGSELELEVNELDSPALDDESLGALDRLELDE